VFITTGNYTLKWHIEMMFKDKAFIVMLSVGNQ
jgi:hypothetical protein